MIPYIGFKVTPPDSGETYFAALVDDNGKGKIISTRSGKWASDDKISTADLMAPEHDYNEWDIIQIPLDELPEIPRNKPAE